MSNLTNIPLISVTYELGIDLLDVYESSKSTATPLKVSIHTNTSAPMVPTMSKNSDFNFLTDRDILADTPSGNPDITIVVGSHLDSVLACPGINDDGSGSSVNLELAI